MKNPDEFSSNLGSRPGTDSMSRRQFLKVIAGFSALASAAIIKGCGDENKPLEEKHEHDGGEDNKSDKELPECPPEGCRTEACLK
jgi:hypothetical protein